MQPVFHLQPMTTYLALSVAQRTFVLALMAAFGALALTLAVAGVYGVVSYVIEQRTRELGLRLALGASPAAVRGMILRQILRVAAIGAFIGFAVATGFSQILSTLLFEVSPLDAETIAAVAVVLLLAALAASYGPVARAARIDPAVVLKSE
jgi:ABC-type antimicrobial peptide transport system permease subunit